MRFTALLHHVYNVERLRAAYNALKRDAAPGIDGETWEHYGEALEPNLADLSGPGGHGAGGAGVGLELARVGVSGRAAGADDLRAPARPRCEDAGIHKPVHRGSRAGPFGLPMAGEVSAKAAWCCPVKPQVEVEKVLCRANQPVREASLAKLLP